jgi:hypothetical protein
VLVHFVSWIFVITVGALAELAGFAALALATPVLSVSVTAMTAKAAN